LEGDRRTLPEADHQELREAVERCWRYGISVGGRYSRSHATVVAMAASLGLISTQQDKNTFSHIWRVTGKGLRYLTEMKDIG
jgi:hypothetical protein